MTSAQLPTLIEPAAGAAPLPAQWTESTRERQGAFLEALAAGGSVRGAARRADVGSSTVYRARRAYPAFRLAWDAALLAARAQAEDVLASRAIDGVEEEVWYHGEVVATRRRYDARLLLAHLARLDRLTGDTRTQAFADDFEDALARFAEGSDTPEKPAKKKTPGQCANRAKSNTPAKEWCRHEQRMVPPLTRLINAMDAERPQGARKPHEFAGYGMGEVEAEQMAAYEQGVPEWWLVLPPAGDDDADEWLFADER